jgi:aspartate aminotransferase
VQLAACAAYEWNAETQDYIAHQRRLLAALGGRIAAELRSAGVRVHAPTGGFYLFPDFSAFTPALAGAGIDSSQALCEHLLRDTGVVLLPGDAFGMPPQHLCARLAYVEFDGRAALQASREVGLRRAFDAVEQQAIFGKTLRGVQRLTRWLIERRPVSQPVKEDQ